MERWASEGWTDGITYLHCSEYIATPVNCSIPSHRECLRVCVSSIVCRVVRGVESILMGRKERETLVFSIMLMTWTIAATGIAIAVGSSGKWVNERWKRFIHLHRPSIFEPAFA